jgi:hypothetical protein
MKYVWLTFVLVIALVWPVIYAIRAGRAAAKIGRVPRWRPYRDWSWVYEQSRPTKRR